MSSKVKIVFVGSLLILLVIFSTICLFMPKIEIELLGDKTQKISIGEKYKELGGIAYVKKGFKKETLKYEIIGKVDTDKIGKYIITYKTKFNNIFKEEMNAYLAAGHTRYNSKVGDFDNCYFREGGGRYSSKYATYDEQEMFAECYAMLMTGECKSRDLIEDFFPKTLQVIAKHIEYVRSLPDDVRCASRN